METSTLIAGVGSALATGAVGSLHCVLMCGPLACAALASADGTSKLRLAMAWHAGRVGAYVTVGLGLGVVGSGVSRVVLGSSGAALPWLMAFGLVVSAFDLGKHLRPLPGVAGVAKVLATAGARLSPTWRSCLLGVATPFLPCGLMYGVFIAAIGASSALGGAAVMAAFALGGLPALAGAQVGARWTDRWPSVRLALHRGVPLAAAVVLVYRAVVALVADGPACH